MALPPATRLLVLSLVAAAAAAAAPRGALAGRVSAPGGFFHTASSQALSRLRLPSEAAADADASSEAAATVKWAILIAGSSGYGNYRHQADICHAYQLLIKNGLKEENIVTFMYDDIAHNPENPRPGVLINQPLGSDVYAGVAKDYTGRNVSVSNFLAALKGDKSGISGGSGKVVASGPEDHVFVFYSDHGGPGILGMPTLPYLFADDVVEALKTKHAAKGFKELVFYLEACESGSIFEGLLPENIEVYATTASNAMESSWGTYCPGMYPEPPAEYETCLGDLYSVAWMEDSDIHNLNKETLELQYELVKDRTSNHETYESGSHVMQYGTVSIDKEPVSIFTGSDPANENAPKAVAPEMRKTKNAEILSLLELPNSTPGLAHYLQGGKANAVNQRDAEMLHLWHKYKNAADGTPRKAQALEEIAQMSAERSHIDRSFSLITKLAVPSNNNVLRAPGQPLVDDWSCFKQMIRAYEAKCGHLTQYGMKHTRMFAEACNAGVSVDKVSAAAADACAGTSRHLAVNGVFSA